LFITRGDTKVESQKKSVYSKQTIGVQIDMKKLKSERRIHEEFEIREVVGNYNWNPHENRKVNVWVGWGFLEFLKLWS